MRIGFDAKRAFNNGRGLGNFSRETLRILTTLSPENQYYLFTPRIDPGIGFECPPNAQLITPNVRGTWPQSVWRTFGIAKEARKRQLDLYHGLSHELPYGIEKTGIRTVLTMHDLMFVTHPQLFSSFDRTMYRKKYLHSCEIADRIIAVSERTKQDLLTLTQVKEDRIEVVYQGCHPRFHRQVSEIEKQRLKTQHHLPEAFLLNVAAIESRKNQLLILKAMAKGAFDLPLVVAGQETDYLRTLQQFAQQHGLENKVIWLPNLPSDELPVLYQSATLFVFPSRYEGFGIPVVEALVSGLPVVAATGSCLEESGGPGCCYVSPDDDEALGETIAALLVNDDRRTTMADAGRRYAERFSDQAINQQLIKIYQTLIP